MPALTEPVTVKIVVESHHSEAKLKGSAQDMKFHILQVFVKRRCIRQHSRGQQSSSSATIFLVSTPCSLARLSYYQTDIILGPHCGFSIVMSSIRNDKFEGPGHTCKLLAAQQSLPTYPKRPDLTKESPFALRPCLRSQRVSRVSLPGLML